MAASASQAGASPKGALTCSSPAEAIQLEHIVRRAHQRPCPVYFLESTQQELPETPGLLDLSDDRLQDDESFYRQLLDLGFDMTLRLVMTRTGDGDDVAEAFDDALRPRLVRAVTDTIGADELAPLDRFRSYFDVDEVRTGTVVVFSCGPAGCLATSVGGDERPPINSMALSGALFDVYLGEDPISDDGKRSVVAGFPGLLG